ncbi:MAG: RlmE family RNA methyltransferase [Betaproteobacteria bacterium]|jgi:23S rRNA Um-2552 2''-O-methyltransferase (EC 2.1.1.-)|nr:RlmE family RNA methyltransferase [Betaproteobacteria bacterium]
MKPTRTSKAWMREHINDPFVQRAKREGYRSRASYKLLEIDARDRLLKPGMTVVDLGCTPGGWSQVARQRMGKQGTVVGIDLLPMLPLEGVSFLMGDFRDEAVNAQLRKLSGNRQVDLVLSDLAPNISGVALYDQARAAELWELALEFSELVLAPHGKFLVKVFHGADFEIYVRHMREVFKRVVTRKPAASRDRSSEVYLLGEGLKEVEQRV